MKTHIYTEKELKNIVIIDPELGETYPDVLDMDPEQKKKLMQHNAKKIKEHDDNLNEKVL